MSDDIMERINIEVERLGGAAEAQAAINRDPPPVSLPEGSFLRLQYILTVLECAETPKTQRRKPDLAHAPARRGDAE